MRINQNPFSAEYDRLGFGRIEIFTKPGTDKYHAQAFFNFGGSLFNSRNPFAPNKPAHQTQMLNPSLGGPLSGRSSFLVDVDRHAVDETAVVNALTLDPSLNVTTFRQAVLNPLTRTTFSPRLDYQLSANHTLAARTSSTVRTRLESGPQGPPPGGAGGPRAGGGVPGGGGPGGGGGPRGGPGGMFGDGSTGKRYSLTFSLSTRNLLNHVNLGSPVGNLSSPLFGASTTLAGGFGPGGSATANRRIEMQVRFSF